MKKFLKNMYLTLQGNKPCIATNIVVIVVLIILVVA